METTVVNIRKSPYDVYIGRKGKGQDGYFGNPIRLNETCPICGQTHYNRIDGREAAQKCYKTWFWHRINIDQEFYERCKALQGKVLGCFCKPLVGCHGEVIAAWCNQGCPRDAEYKPEKYGLKPPTWVFTEPVRRRRPGPGYPSYAGPLHPAEWGDDFNPDRGLPGDPDCYGDRP